jgi:hypothetical protein
MPTQANCSRIPIRAAIRLALVLFCYIVHAGLSVHAQTTSQEWSEQMHAHFRQLPDCEYDYTATLPGTRSAGKILVNRYHFSHFQGKFYFKRFSAENVDLPESWMAYDGNLYYRLSSDTGILSFGRSFEGGQKHSFVSGFAENPAFAPYYYCIFSGKDLNFALPFLTERELWTKALVDVTPAPSPKGGSHLAFQITWPNRSRIFTLDPANPYPVSCVTVPNPDTGRRIFSDIVGSGTYPSGAIAGFQIPDSLVQYVGEKDEEPREVLRLTMDRGSFKVITTTPEIERYQIPRVLAKKLYDNDLKHEIQK